jgi:hypothetical protein
MSASYTVRLVFGELLDFREGTRSSAFVHNADIRQSSLEERSDALEGFLGGVVVLDEFLNFRSRDGMEAHARRPIGAELSRRSAGEKSPRRGSCAGRRRTRGGQAGAHQNPPSSRRDVVTIGRKRMRLAVLASKNPRARRKRGGGSALCG